MTKKRMSPAAQSRLRLKLILWPIFAAILAGAGIILWQRLSSEEPWMALVIGSLAIFPVLKVYFQGKKAARN